MNSRNKGGKIAAMILLGTAAIFLFGFIVMSLWNGVLVEVLGVSEVSFWQALGILVLAKILFGGFRGKGHWGGPQHGWKGGMREKWQNMTDEEKELVKQQWRDKCRYWGRKNPTEQSEQPGSSNSNID